MIQIFIDFFKWLCGSQIVNLIALVAGFRAIMWLIKHLCQFSIWMVKLISCKKDILITFFTRVKDLVSSLIYRKYSLIH
ncbi:MAG: hypothetical protein D8H99_36115 [Streptococcus sp.]|nr:MAG: hypothetical protein D8H99_36115 [Streptococcus sp.]